MQAQRAQRVAKIAQQVVDPARRECIATFLVHLLEAAESEAGLASRLFGRLAPGDEIGGVLIEMEAQLFIDLLVPALAGKEAKEVLKHTFCFYILVKQGWRRKGGVISDTTRMEVSCRPN